MLQRCPTMSGRLVPSHALPRFFVVTIVAAAAIGAIIWRQHSVSHQCPPPRACPVCPSLESEAEASKQPEASKPAAPKQPESEASKQPEASKPAAPKQPESEASKQPEASKPAAPKQPEASKPAAPC